MKEINQGTLYGHDLVLKVPDDFKENDIINENTLEKYVNQQKAIAVDEFQSEKFLKDIS